MPEGAACLAPSPSSAAGRSPSRARSACSPGGAGRTRLRQGRLRPRQPPGSGHHGNSNSPCLPLPQTVGQPARQGVLQKNLLWPGGGGIGGRTAPHRARPPLNRSGAEPGKRAQEFPRSLCTPPPQTRALWCLLLPLSLTGLPPGAQKRRWWGTGRVWPSLRAVLLSSGRGHGRGGRSCSPRASCTPGEWGSILGICSSSQGGHREHRQPLPGTGKISPAHSGNGGLAPAVGPGLRRQPLPPGPAAAAEAGRGLSSAPGPAPESEWCPAGQQRIPLTQQNCGWALLAGPLARPPARLLESPVTNVLPLLPAIKLQFLPQPPH